MKTIKELIEKYEKKIELIRVNILFNEVNIPNTVVEHAIQSKEVYNKFIEDLKGLQRKNNSSISEKIIRQMKGVAKYKSKGC